MVHHVYLAHPCVHFVRHSEFHFVLVCGFSRARKGCAPLPTTDPASLANMQVHLLAKDKDFILFTSRTLEIQGFFVYFLFFSFLLLKKIERKIFTLNEILQLPFS